MKTYIITLSQFFPKTHPRSGQRTFFFDNLFVRKKHTIRANYEFWKDRFEFLDNCDAQLSVRFWTGKPYSSPQHQFVSLGHTDCIGLQRLRIYKKDGFSAQIVEDDGRERFVDIRQLAHNDGLSVSDWCDWFAKYDLSQDFALIHFTKFRY